MEKYSQCHQIHAECYVNVVDGDFQKTLTRTKWTDSSKGFTSDPRHFQSSWSWLKLWANENLHDLWQFSSFGYLRTLSPDSCHVCPVKHSYDSHWTEIGTWNISSSHFSLAHGPAVRGGRLTLQYLIMADQAGNFQSPLADQLVYVWNETNLCSTVHPQPFTFNQTTESGRTNFLVVSFCFLDK